MPLKRWPSGQSLLENLRDAEPVGRLVIDLEESMLLRSQVPSRHRPEGW